MTLSLNSETTVKPLTIKWVEPHQTYEVTEALAKRLSDYVHKKQLKAFMDEKLMTLKNIIEEFFFLPPGSLLTKSRKRQYVVPRQLYHYFAKKHTKCSLQTIGDSTFKDHATVIHSIRTVENMLFTKGGKPVDQESFIMVTTLSALIKKVIGSDIKTDILNDCNNIAQL